MQPPKGITPLRGVPFLMRQKLVDRTSDGILVAPVGAGGLWEAFRELRGAMRGVAGSGRVQTSFISALAPDGSPATSSSGTAVLIAGYRVRPPA